MGSLRRSALFLVLLLISSVLLCVRPVEAGTFRYADIYWCAATEDYQRPTSNTITFFVQVGHSRFAGQEVGDTFYEPFYFGDGTSTVLALTVTEVYPDWFLAKGEVVHRYDPAGDRLLSAGLEGCCRIDGTAGTDGLNNRNGEPYQVKVAVSRNAQVGGCSPRIFVPPVLSFYAVPGLPVPFDYLLHVSSSNPAICTLAQGSEAGGGSSPPSLRVGVTNCIIQWGNPGSVPFRFWTVQVKNEGYAYYQHPNFIQQISSAAADFLIEFLPDVTPPICRVDRIDPGPPTRLFIYIQDPQSGLSSIEVLEQTNATMSVPSLGIAQTRPTIVAATKIDQSQPAHIRLRVRDEAGNVTECDPVLTEEVRSAGRPESHVFPEIPPEEHVVTVLNGNPGLTQIQIDVNGQKFTVAGLRSGEERTIDVASAIVPGVNSTFTLTSHGQPGGAATIMIWDGHSEQTP